MNEANENLKTGVYRVGPTKVEAWYNNKLLGFRYGELAEALCANMVDKAKGLPVKRIKRNKFESYVAPTPTLTASNAIPGNIAIHPEMIVTVANERVVSIIPDRDPNFVPFGAFRDIEQIIKSGMFFPVWLTGPTGNGKSALITEACARLGKELIRFQVTPHTDEEQLMGCKTLVDGNIEIIDGPIVMAAERGCTLLLDEISIADPANLMTLQNVLEGKPFYYKLRNKVITPKPGFNIFATDNTKGSGTDDGRYIGTKIQNMALTERFSVTLVQPWPSDIQELKIIRNCMRQYNCVNEDFAQSLAKLSDALRKTFEDGGIDDVLPTRRLIQIVQTYAIFRDPVKALTMGTNRYDEASQAIMIAVFDKILPDNTPIVEEEIPTMVL